MSDQNLADDLEPRPFSERHIGPDDHQVTEMLKALGLSSLEALMDDAVPGRIRSDGLGLPPAASERAAAAELRQIAGMNNPLVAMIGLGYHGTITPPVVRRNVLEDPSWYTAYTPYQPEISQGRLEALLNFQTMVADLTGLPTSNASLLDEGTAAAEAMTLVRRANKADGPFVVDADALPQTIEVVRTRAEAMGIEVLVADLADGLPEGDLSGVLVQYPGASGRILDPRAGDRGDARARRARRRGRRPARPHPARVARARSAPTWPSGPPSASASRCSTAARTPASWRCGRGWSATCPVASSASRSTRPGVRRTGSRCRPASSTSAVTGPRPTSAPRRCCSRWSPRCTPSTTAPGPAADRRSDAPPRPPAGRAPPRGRRRGRARGLLRHRAGASARPGCRGRRGRPRVPGSTCGSSTRTTSGSPRRRPPMPTSSTPCATAFGVATGDVAVARDAARRAAAYDGLHDPRGVQHPPLRDLDAALPAPALGARLRAGPRDDPARLVHDEAERDHGDGAGEPARLRRPAPVRAGRGRARLPHA